MAKSQTKKKSPSYVLIFTIGIVLIVILIAVSQVLDMSAPVESLNSVPAERAVLSDQDVPRVKMQEAKSAFDSGEAVFVDVRSLPSFEAAHIPGALSIEIPEIEAETAKLDPEGLYITYCT
jgi:3-mercaptopyruvate sulfurtransferase SseA